MSSGAMSNLFDISELSRSSDEEDGAEDVEKVLQFVREQQTILDTVRQQPIPISHKLKLHRRARRYVRDHAGNLRKSQTTREKILQKWKIIRKTANNFLLYATPWEHRIKQIEGYQGSVVASYFVFLRWIIWVNVWITLLPVCFIILPQALSTATASRSTVPETEISSQADLKTLWDATGIVEYSFIFYGYYGNKRGEYHLPLAYLLTGLATTAYSFIIVLRKMAENSRRTGTSSKEDHFTFSWKLFCGWEFSIENRDTASNKHNALSTGIKESIREEKEKNRDKNKYMLTALRILGNVIFLLLLALSTWIIQLCVQRSRDLETKKRVENYTASFWEDNELTVVMTLIATMFPNFFDLISLMEKYHPRNTLRWQLARIFALNLLNLYTLFIALYWKQQDMQDMTNVGVIMKGNSSCSDVIVTDSYGSASTEMANCSHVENNTDTESLTLCWETSIGQEVFKLTVMDLVFILGQVLVQDFLRGLFVRYCRALCCWDLEKTFPEYADFKTADHLLHLINNQGMIWIGTFFAPGLPVLNLAKLLLLLYVRCWTATVCNVPQEQIFRASRSNNFYYALLLVMLFLCTLPPLFAIVAIEPSKDCGPFSGQSRMYDVLADAIANDLPAGVTSVIGYIASPGVIIPSFLLLSMAIYYLVVVGGSMKKANQQLSAQLQYERTEGRRRVYAMADAKRVMESDDEMGSSKKQRMPSAVSSVMAAAKFAKLLTASQVKVKVQQSSPVADPRAKSPSTESNDVSGPEKRPLARKGQSTKWPLSPRVMLRKENCTKFGNKSHSVAIGEVDEAPLSEEADDTTTGYVNNGFVDENDRYTGGVRQFGNRETSDKTGKSTEVVLPVAVVHGNRSISSQSRNNRVPPLRSSCVSEDSTVYDVSTAISQVTPDTAQTVETPVRTSPAQPEVNTGNRIRSLFQQWRNREQQ